jgi:hypothetical protein
LIHMIAEAISVLLPEAWTSDMGAQQCKGHP